MKHLIAFFSLLVCLNIQAQTFKVSGTVTDEEGEFLIGVNIVCESLNKGTITDFDGRYDLELPKGTYTLVVSYIGYKVQKIEGIKIEDSDVANINFILKEDAVALDEVVMVSSSRLSKRRANKRIRGSVSNPIPIQPNESYKYIEENGFKTVEANPLSTFSIDVDRAAYSNVRRFINNNQQPPKDAVRIEELINYFHYDYPKPIGKDPIAISHELSQCPWNTENLLLRIAVAGEQIETENLPSSNLVFLLDVSGSMGSENKLPLLKQSLLLLLNQLKEEDRVAIVVYAGSAGLVLPSTSVVNKQLIANALESLEAGGSTAGGAGIKLAYKIAKENYIKNGNNRVILATDGDFNVGVNSDGDLERLIKEKRNDDIFLTCLGFGMGNYKDSKLETLANKGNGNYGYVDNINEAKKMLVKEFGSTMHTIAKDVKIQVEFNPTKVSGYRLLGYENRLLNDEDFLDDKKDAGEIGSGHTVTALYEIVPVGVKSQYLKKVPKLKYSKDKTVKSKEIKSELATAKIRYKEPKGKDSKELSHTIKKDILDYENCSDDHRFISAVTLFGLVLKESEYIETRKMKDVLELLENANTDKGYRTEFKELVLKAKKLK